MARIFVDDKPYPADEEENLLQICLSLGFDLPYFCWHPAMGSVGACRQCAVKQFMDEQDEKGRIVMACMTPAADGTRISIDDPEARAFRRSVIEWLMTNHPHDCPVCEEGGECHLQDMTLMTGHVYRRYRFNKRSFRNQDLGPFIGHEMNRCITCYRCVRFYQDYADGRDLQALSISNHVYFGRHEDGTLENEFSGNLIEVCPTGVFTDKTYGQAYTRKWDLQCAPSVCTHCGVGCNTSPGERYGKLRRIMNRYNSQVNGYFLCDRGRFGYGFVNSEERVGKPRLRRTRGLAARPEPVSKAEALLVLGARLRSARLIGIGSPRASLEANFALRALVGPDRFYSGLSARDHRLIALILDVLQRGPVCGATLAEAERADAVLILGEDLTNTAPRLALSLRQAARQKWREIAAKRGVPHWQDASVRTAAGSARTPFIIATPFATKLDDAATATWHGAPDDLARLGCAVAHEISAAAPAVSDLPDESRRLARHIAQVFETAQRPLVVSGTSCGSAPLIEAAANIAWASFARGQQASLCYSVPECNSLGLGLMNAGCLEDAFEALAAQEGGALIVLENDLYRRTDRARVDAALAAAEYLTVIDYLQHETTAQADLVLPAGTFAEADGTFVSFEGRAQRYFQVFEPEGEIQESWRWIEAAMLAADRAEACPWGTLDAVTSACADALPILGPIRDAAPPAGLRLRGMRIPRAPHCYSGRTAMTANRSVHEPKPPDDPDSPLAFSMEGYHGRSPAALMPFVWAPGWSSNEALNKFQDEVGGALRGGDPGVRLIEPDRAMTPRFFEPIPKSFARRQGEWLILPLHHIFGSEELSMRSSAVAQRAPRAYLALNEQDAAELGVAVADQAEVALGSVSLRLPVQSRADLPRGIAGLPVGIGAVAGIVLPQWACVRKPAIEEGLPVRYE